MFTQSAEQGPLSSSPTPAMYAANDESGRGGLCRTTYTDSGVVTAAAVLAADDKRNHMDSGDAEAGREDDRTTAST